MFFKQNSSLHAARLLLRFVTIYNRLNRPQTHFFKFADAIIALSHFISNIKLNQNQVIRLYLKTLRYGKAITTALKPLQAFADALSGGEYVRVSYVKPVLHLFNSKILKPGSWII